MSQCTPVDPNTRNILTISGLAYNTASHVLWVATSSETDTVYKLQMDPTEPLKPDCEVQGTLLHPLPGFNGGGLDMDDTGNLWMVSFLGDPNHAGAVYLVESGLPATPPPAPAPLPATPPPAPTPPSITDVVRRVDPRAFKSPGLRRSLEARLEAVRNAISDRQFSPAAAMLRNLRMRVDGCGATADRDDWIVDCTSQLAVRSAINALIDSLRR
jgi:hypothetical protein